MVALVRYWNEAHTRYIAIDEEECGVFAPVVCFEVTKLPNGTGEARNAGYPRNEDDAIAWLRGESVDLIPRPVFVR